MLEGQTAGATMFHRALRWALYLLSPLLLISCLLWLRVLKGPETKARFGVVNKMDQPITITPLGSIVLLSRFAGFPTLQNSHFRLSPGEKRIFYYSCMGQGMVHLFVRTEDGQDKQYSEGPMADDCGVKVSADLVRTFFIEEQGQLFPAEPRVLEWIKQYPPGRIGRGVLAFYGLLIFPAFWMMIWRLQRQKATTPEALAK